MHITVILCTENRETLFQSSKMGIGHSINLLLALVLIRSLVIIVRTLEQLFVGVVGPEERGPEIEVQKVDLWCPRLVPLILIIHIFRDCTTFLLEEEEGRIDTPASWVLGVEHWKARTSEGYAVQDNRRLCHSNRSAWWRMWSQS